MCNDYPKQYRGNEPTAYSACSIWDQLKQFFLKLISGLFITSTERTCQPGCKMLTAGTENGLLDNGLVDSKTSNSTLLMKRYSQYSNASDSMLKPDPTATRPLFRAVNAAPAARLFPRTIEESINITKHLGIIWR